ncbi:NmrA-like domain-containing protein 1 [Aspergillus hancockii]|nr:NmrA-like domain-containing protein 1 [Aspergillus hancockii]
MAVDTKVVTVFGATGQQGSSVVRSLSKNPLFQVRCITRDPSSKRAKALASPNVEVVRADGFNKSELLAAFTGSWAAFVNTNSEDPDLLAMGKTDEDLGSNVICCAAQAGVKHLVYSSGPSAKELTNGALSIPALDMKARVEKLACATSTFQSVTPIIAAWFMENFRHEGMSDLFGGFPLVPDHEGYLTFKMPLLGGKEDFPWISITDDFGDLVHGVLLNPMRWNRRVIQATSAILPPAEVVNTFISVTGKKARFIPLTSPNELETHGVESYEMERDIFFFSQLREGEYFCNGPTEIETAALLKKAAFKAKGNRGRDVLTTVREYFEREFPPV